MISETKEILIPKTLDEFEQWLISMTGMMENS